MHPLQSVVTAAARLIVKRQKYDHPLHDELYWLPIQYRFIDLSTMHTCLQVPAQCCSIVSRRLVCIYYHERYA